MQKLLEVILGIEISSIEYIEDQLTLDEKPDAKSVRLEGIIDLNLIMKGENYKSLRRSYIIFICMFDPFGEGHHIYTIGEIIIEYSC